MTRRVAWSLLAALLALNLLLRFGRLDAPPHPIFDEGTFYIAAAQSYLDGAPDPNFEHPPLGKAAIAAGLALFGDTPWGWRSAAAAAGTTGVLLTYLLGGALWGRREAGLIAAALLTAESLWFVLSRMAMLDPFLCVGLLAALLFGWRYRQGGRWADLIACGVCWGLAAGVKWSAALALAPLALAVLGAGSGQRGGAPAPASRPWRTAAALALLLATAFAAYAVPFMALSHLGPAELAERHLRMLAYQSAAGEQGVGLWDRIGPPLLWLLDIPVVFSAAGNRETWVLVMANPLVFWPGLIAIAGLARRGLREPFGPAAYLAAAALALYLPWLLTARARYVYYLLPLMPLLCLALADLLLRAPLDSSPEQAARLEKWRPFVVTALVALCGAGFAAMYPLLTAVGR